MAVPHHLLCRRLRAWLFLAGLLVLSGCSTKGDNKPEVPVIPPAANKEKDAYVDRLESEAGEGAAALAAAKPHIEGKGKPLVELTETRLSGIQKPKQETVDKYRRAIESQKALDEEKNKAKKVDEETDKLSKRVAEVDKENNDLKTSIEAMKREEAYEDLRDVCFWLTTIFAVAGAGLLVMSTVIGKGRAAGLILLLVSAGSAAAPFVIRDVVESLWFRLAIGAVIVLAGCFGLYAGYDAHMEARRRLTKPDGPV